MWFFDLENQGILTLKGVSPNHATHSHYPNPRLRVE